MELNDFQQNIVNQYIECGGRGNIYQSSRAAGYSTVMMYLALQQLLDTDRKVLFVYDDPIHTVADEFRKVAKRFFDFDVYVKNGALYVGNKPEVGNKRMALVKPNFTGNAIRGHRFDDIYGELRSDTRSKFPDFFECLYWCQNYRNDNRYDGTGFCFLLTRESGPLPVTGSFAL